MSKEEIILLAVLTTVSVLTLRVITDYGPGTHPATRWEAVEEDDEETGEGSSQRWTVGWVRR